MDEIINLHLSQGYIQLSSSPFASPSFLVPKSDAKALPCWVCDYCRINENTIPDNYPMPKVSEILSDCACRKFFCKIDLKNSFFQTRMHPNDIHKTAVSTSHRLYEWTVMPMGLQNASAIQQHQLESALRDFIWDICHCFLDDIVGWSGTVNNHVKNIYNILLALRKAGVYINPKKTILFATSIEFLGHLHIRPWDRSLQKEGRSNSGLACPHINNGNMAIPGPCLQPSKLFTQTVCPLLHS